MHSPLPLTRELVLIGGGHTHALVLRRWGMAPLPGARLTLINPGPTAPYTGMLPGFVAGHYGRDELEIDLVKLARFAGARLILGRADAIDRARRRIHIAGRGEIAYDIASLDIGITSDLPRFAAHSTAAKPLDSYARAWTAFRAAAAKGEKPPEIAVIGAGVGGMELAMAMAHALRSDGLTPQIAVIDRAAALPGLSLKARDRLLTSAQALGVTLTEQAGVTAVTADAITLANGQTIPSAFTVTATGARPQAWLADTGLDLTDGFVTVDRHLRSTNDPAIYAAGDCAHFQPDPRPKAGVYAVRAAPVLYHNLRADLTGTQRRRFKPQSDYLKLISLGQQSALADKWGLQLSGPWLWRWKDRIDRRFMDRLATLPKMPPPRLPRDTAKGVQTELQGGKPLCGGCGAKVGGGTLTSVLQSLPTPHRDDLVSGPGDDAAILQIGTETQVITTDHLRGFTEDPWLMARIAAVHAMGDIWAMGAKPQAALATVILPRLTEAMQEAWLTEIMAAATDRFAAEGAAIAGGHTTLGAELTIGFTVTGLAEHPPITLSGGQPGDALILTKPIGTGTILAAEMQGAARGPWVAACLAEMARPQGAAATALAHANAMTDVTGFGLAGHLMALCDASQTGATLSLADIPLYNGAETLATQGIRSTLHPANRAMAARMTLPDTPAAELLFDPQTAGGLLAAVPPGTAAETLAQLHDAGFQAAIIGQLTAGPPHITVQ